MENYFKLTAETKVNIFGVKLFRIELTIDCKWGKKGEKGGWIESEKISNGNARVSGNAWVSGDAQVYGNARVSGNAQVYGNAWKKSPLQIQGSRHFLNICAIGILRIGCQEKPLNDWKKIFKTIGVEYGYTKEEIAEYGLYINLAIKLNK